MKKIVLLISILFTGFTFQITLTQRINAVFFDIESVFSTDSMRASGYVGKIDSLRYAAQVGNLPSQQDLFAQLKDVKAQSKQVTYNKNLAMPLIFSDWLATIQTSTKIKDIIQKYFANKDISNIEKKVLFAIVSMMMTPQHLADTQKVNSKVETLLQKLKNQGVKLFLVGNWAHISSLKSEFTSLFRLFNGVYVSGDLHLLKPAQEFYQMILSKSGFLANECVWVETESKFISKAKSYGMQVAGYELGNHDALLRALRTYGLNV